MCWQLNVPSVVKMFIWRACHNSLPTKMNLYRRGVCDNTQCPICLQDAETIEHIVWECPSSNNVWGESTIKLQKCQKGGGDFQHIFLEVVKRCDQKEVDLFAVIARKIWMRRNQVVHGGPFSHPNQVLKEAESVLEEYRLSHVTSNMPQPSSSSMLVEKWMPPPRNFVKIN